MLRCYSNVGGNWGEVPCLNAQRKYPTMTTVGDYILVTGGHDPSDYNKYV